MFENTEKFMASTSRMGESGGHQDKINRRGRRQLVSQTQSAWKLAARGNQADFKEVFARENVL